MVNKTHSRPNARENHLKKEMKRLEETNFFPDFENKEINGFKCEKYIANTKHYNTVNKEKCELCDNEKILFDVDFDSIIIMLCGDCAKIFYTE